MALQGTRKGLKCFQVLLLSFSTPPEGRWGGRSQVKARGGGSGRGCDGDGCQSCRVARRSCHGASALAAAGGQSRGESSSNLGLGLRAGQKGTPGASSRQPVSKSCSLFRFQVTNQVSEVPCRSRPWSSLWPSTPPRSLRVWDLIPGRSLLRVFPFYGCLSPTWILKMLPAVSALPYGPIPPSSRFMGFRGFRDFTLYPYCSFPLSFASCTCRFHNFPTPLPPG